MLTSGSQVAVAIKELLHGRYHREGFQQTLPEMWKQDKAGQYIEQEMETLQFMDKA